MQNIKNKQIPQATPRTETDSPNKSKSKNSHKKPVEKRSCFACREQGHVASSCPNKKSVTQYRPVTKDKSPVKTANQQGSSSSSHEKPVTKSLGSNNVGNAKTGLGYNAKPQSRFISPKADRPRSTSPKKRNFESQSHRFSTPQRNRTPQRFNTP